MKKLIVGILFGILSVSSVFASDLPFTDVKTSDSYYEALSYLYKNNVIRDSGDHLFRPNGLVHRDEFVSIIVGSGCKKCLYPTMFDIERYTISPFIDLDKINPYFYCIAYAKDLEVVKGYVLDENGKTLCQNGKTFTESPFCPENNIERIEAVGALLRQANIWNETLNSSPYEKTVTINDIDPYWYGYAQKGIAAGILTINSEGKIYPHESITRKELVEMAEKIYSINQCQWSPNDGLGGTGTTSGSGSNNLTADINIFDPSNPDSCKGEGTQTTFPDSFSTVYDFSAKTDAVGDLEYIWEFTNITTGEIIKKSGKCLDNFDLKTSGKWLVKLTIRNKTTGQTAVSISTIDIKKPGDEKKCNDLSTDITATPLSGFIPFTDSFSSNVHSSCGGPYTYKWDFGDGTSSTDPNPNHLYDTPGVYTVTLHVTDANGNDSTSQVVIVVEKKEIIVPPANNLTANIQIFDPSNSGSNNGIGTQTTFPDPFSTVYDFNAQTDSTGNLEYTWEFTNTTTGEIIKKTGKFLDDFDLKTPGKWIVKLDIKDKDTGQVATSISTIDIKKPGDEKKCNDLSSDITATPLSGFIPFTDSFSSNVHSSCGGPYTYKWDFGDGTSSTDPNPNHLYDTPGVYTVTLHVTDANGNDSTSQVVIVVEKKEIIVPPANNLTADINIFDPSNPDSCKGEGTQTTFPDPFSTVYDFSAKTDAVGDLEYIWEFTNITTGEIIKKSGKCLDNFDLKTSGKWLVKLTIRNKTTGQTAVSISTIDIKKPGDEKKCNDLSTDITATPLSGFIPFTDSFSSNVHSSCGGPYTYKWDFGDGTSSTDPNPNHLYDTPGVYTVTLHVTDANGNVAISQVVILVKKFEDRDHDGILDEDDTCPDVLGLLINKGCPKIKVFKIDYNAILDTCMKERAQTKGGFFLGQAVCTSCPCEGTLDYLAAVRVCDIIFPAITSPDKKTVYGRGNIWQIKE